MIYEYFIVIHTRELQINIQPATSIIRYCIHGDLATLCPEGYYCPAGTGLDWQQCPPGTYNNETGLQQLSECKPCPGGHYCEDYALVEPSGQCAPGYYCEFGVDRAEPTGVNASLVSTVLNGECQLSGIVFMMPDLARQSYMTV